MAVIRVYRGLRFVPIKYHKTLFSLTMGNRGWMQIAAHVLLGWKIDKPVAVAFENKKPIGWMFYDPIDKWKLNMYVSRQHRYRGIARKMAEAIKNKYPRMRMSVYHPHARNVIKGLTSPRKK